MENNFKKGNIVKATKVYQDIGEMEVVMVDEEIITCQYLDEKKQVQQIRISYKNLVLVG